MKAAVASFAAAILLLVALVHAPYYSITSPSTAPLVCASCSAREPAHRRTGRPSFTSLLSMPSFSPVPLQARVSEPVSLMSRRAREQQLWNAASNDEINTYNVGKSHSYGMACLLSHDAGADVHGTAWASDVCEHAAPCYF